MIADFAKNENRNIKAKYQFLSVWVDIKEIANGINYIQGPKMNNNPLAYKATMYFECQTDFGRWVKFSCITMSLFIVMYIHFHVTLTNGYL